HLVRPAAARVRRAAGARAGARRAGAAGIRGRPGARSGGQGGPRPGRGAAAGPGSGAAQVGACGDRRRGAGGGGAAALGARPASRRPRAAASAAGALDDRPARAPAPLSIYVLVDALGWEVLRYRPFLDDLWAERRWLVTILGYSSGAIPTILTGQTPSQHGHWNLIYRDPARSPFGWTRPLARLPK